MPERPCPLCAGTMRPGRFGPLELDVCLTCGGVWFDCGELSQLIAGGPQIVRRLGEQVRTGAGTTRRIGQTSCARCRAPLQSVQYAGMQEVFLDNCQFCEGTWTLGSMLILLADALEGASEWDRFLRTQELAGQASAATQPAPKVARAAAPAPVEPRAPASPSRELQICPRCGEANDQNVPSCWACGQALQGPEVGTCPSCEAKMRRVASTGAIVNHCEGCGGIWVTAARLNHVLHQSGKDREVLRRQLARIYPERRKRLRLELNCPECAAALGSRNLPALGGHTAHFCPRCASFFVAKRVLDEVLADQD